MGVLGHFLLPAPPRLLLLPPLLLPPSSLLFAAATVCSSTPLLVVLGRWGGRLAVAVRGLTRVRPLVGQERASAILKVYDDPVSS